MHIPSSIDTDSSSITTLLSRACPIASPLSPTTQSDILEILQREQDHAMSLLSLSPLLSSLFISYANRAAALESAAATPSPESEEWKGLQTVITTLREENEKLKLENHEVAGKLESAEASQEAFRSQVTNLKEVNTTQQDDIKVLRAELVEAKGHHDRLIVDSNAERAALQIQVLDLEAQRGELKETVVEQQIKISKLERRGPNGLSNLPAIARPTVAIATRELHSEGLSPVDMTAGITEARERAGTETREEREEREREAMERMERELRELRERDRMDRMERERMEQKRMKRERMERERMERDAREEKELAEREAREQAENTALQGVVSFELAPTSAKPISGWLKSFADGV